MSDFDAQGYFDRRYGVTVGEAQGKIAALEAAKAQKLQSMQAFKQARDASTAANQNAWVNQLGLDPDGALSTALNIGAAGVDGGFRILKNAATAIPTIDVAIRNYGIPDTVRAAKSRMDDGIATPEDMDLLSQREPGNKNTFFERLQQVEGKSRRVNALNQVLDTSSIVDKTNQDALTTELKDVAKPGLDQMKAGWEAGIGEGKADMLSGLAKALMTIPGAALNNPAAAFEFVASNVPQLVAAGVGGATGMAATNVPYAIDAYREGIEEYQKKNGKMPDQAWMEVNAAKAASLLVAETVGDKLTLGVGKSVGSITDPAKAALDKGIERLSREAFKTSLKGVGAAVAPVARTAAAIGQGGLGEFATEAYQTAVEESIKGNEASLEDAFVGGAIGAISGGTSSGGIAVAKEGVDGVVAGLTKALTPSAKKDAPLTDLLPQSKELEALFVANQADTTDEPTRAANLVKAQELVASLEAAVAQTQQTSAVGSNIAPADLEEMKATLEVVKKVLEQTDPADTARVAKLTQAVTEMESTIAAADKKASVSQKASLSGRERELNKARLVLEAMTEQAELAAPTVDTTEEVDEADQTPTTKAVRRIVLSMAAVDALSAEEATQMADDTTLELSDKQRTYLRTFSEARVAENSMKNLSTVLDEILTDKGGKNLSLVDYREKIALALNKGNQSRAGQLVGMLASFTRDHGNKAKLAQELYAKALKGGAPTQMVSDGQGNWSVPAQPLSPEQLRINGGLTISNGSGKLVQDIGKGSKALALNLAQQEAAYDMTFGSKPTDVKVEPITSAKQIIENAKAAIEPAKQEEAKAEPNSTKEEATSEVPTSAVVPAGTSEQGGTVEAETKTKVVKKQISAIDKAIARIEKAQRKLKRNKGGMSLWSAIKNSLSAADLSNIYGPDWKKRYTMLRGNPGRSLIDIIADGALNEFLPYKMRVSDTNPDADVQAAEQYIYDKLQNRDYLTEDTKLALAQLDLSIDELRAELPTIESIENEIAIAEAEIASQAQDSNREATETPTQSAAGSVAGDVGKGEAGSTGSSESTTQDVIDGDIEPGTLDAFSKEAVAAEKEKTDYRKMNLLTRFFKQKAGKAGSYTFRPLVAVKDFLSQWKLGAATPEMSLTPEGKAEVALEDHQKDALTHFRKVAQSWLSVVTGNLYGKTKEEFAHTDVMQFFLTQMPDGKGNLADMPENVKTAIALVAYQYVAELAGGSGFNTPKFVNRLIQKHDDYRSWTPQQLELFEAGTGEHQVQNSLGKAALQVLGIKPNKDAPQNISSRLESALGAHAVKLLIDRGLLTVTTFGGPKWRGMTGNDEINDNAKIHFVKLTREADRTPVAKALEIYQAQQNTQDILGKLFGVETRNPEPSFEPVPYVQTSPNNTQQTISETTAKYMKHENASANFLKLANWAVVNLLSADNMGSIIGIQDVEQDTVHVDNELSVLAKNAGLQKEYEVFMDYVDGVLANSPGKLEQAMYLSHVVWRNQRVGIEGIINPQTSKFHRFMLTRESWKSPVHFANEAELNSFRLRVAEGMGVKTENVQLNEALKQFTKKTGSEEVKAAVAALRKVLANPDLKELSDADQAAIVAGVAAGGEKMHSFDALMALAQYEEAVDNGKDSFETDLAGEIDGKTNGPMLSFLLLGAAHDSEKLFERLNQGGFYSTTDKVDQFSDWRSQVGNQDLYENTSSALVKRIEEELLGFPEDDLGMYGPVFHFIGNLLNKSDAAVKAGRNLVKTPITALAFGSSLTRAVESMADSFLESIYKKIEDTAKELKNPEKAPGVAAKTLEIVRQLNTLVPALNLSERGNIIDLMNRPFTVRERILIQNAFKEVMEDPIKKTLTSEFGAFIAVRDSVNKTGELAFTVYESAYRGLRQAYIDRLVKEGKLAVDPKGNTIQDLSQEQEAELRAELADVVPTVATAMSKGDKNRTSGMLLGKEKSRPSNDPTYKGSIKFGTPFAKADNTAEKAEKDSSTALGNAMTREGPGVGTLVGQVHSSDSNISHSAAFMGEVLNVHDAHVTGLKTFTQTAKNLNKATWQTLLDYSPAQEILNTFGMTLVGVANMLKDPKVSDLVRNTLLAGLTKYAKDKSTKKSVLTVDSLLENALKQAQNTAFQSDSIRLETLSMLGALDQYPALGGQFIPTDGDRAEAANRITELKSEPHADLVAAVKTIQDALAGRKVSEEAVAPTTDPVPDVDENVEESSEKVDPADGVVVSPWGAVGKPTVKPESDIEGIFDFETEMPAKELARILYEVVGRRPGKNNKFSLLLLKAIGKVLPANTKVRMVMPNTPADQVQERPKGRARGWFVPNPDNPVLYVMGSDFVDSGMNAETLIHELVHAALSDAIYQVEAGKASKEATELVNELGRLMKAARAYVKDNNLGVLFDAAVSNIDELVAWGMANEAFQQEVLNKIQMEDKNKTNVLVTGAKAFYDALSRFFFGGVSPNAEKALSSGMEVLMTNVSGLFAVAATAPGSNETKRDVLSMAAQAASTYNTKDIFNALGTSQLSQLSPVSAQFAVHLEELLDGIVFRLHGVFGSFKESLMKDQVISPEDVFQKAIATGKAPFASQLLASGFRISEQEAFVMEQVEVTVQTALGGNDEGSMAYAARGLSKLYEEARRSLTVKDFLTGDKTNPTQAEQDNAQALYDFVFKVEASNGTMSNYLARFAALGMAHEGFNTLLKSKTLDKPAAPKVLTTMSIANRLGAIVQQIMQWFSEKMTRTYKGQPANSKLSTLVKQLVDIEGKRRNMLKNPAGSSLMDQLSETGTKVADAVNTKIVDFANSSFVQNSPSQLFKAGVTVGKFIAEHRTDQLLEAMAKMRDRYSSGQLGLTFGTIKDALGAPELFQKILRATKSLEKDRKHISTQTSKLMLQGFVNQGRDLEDKDKAALSNVILRTGSHVLLDHFNDTELHKLLSNPADLSKAIAAWEAKLSVYPKDVQKYYANQSRALGHHLVVGEARGPNMMMNAGNIASLHDTGRQGKVTPDQVTEATKDLDVLITLYALSYSSGTQLNLVAKLLSVEMARTDKQGNGLMNVMYGHKALENEAKQRLFSGTETMLAKGYTSEIFNPYTEIVAAKDGDPEAQVLIDKGYTAGPPLKKDPSDPDKGVNRLYIRRGGGLSQHVTGIYSYTGKEASGSTTHNGNTSMHNKAGRLNTIHLNTMKARKAKEVDQLFTQDYDPLLDTHKHAAPVLDPSGKVVNYRYLMTSDLKDTLLERNNSFEVVMGSMAASSFDKQTATEQNTVATKALHDLYKVDYAKNPEAYLEVGPNSTDPELREIWRLLPYETQQAIRREWGAEKMMVRNDLLDLSFGYRKLSLAKLWDKPESARNQLEFAVTWFAEHVVEQAARVGGATAAEAKQRAKRTQHIVQKSERMWMDLMKEVKDIIVVKTGTVMIGNILSNVSLLALNGVSLAEMSKHHQTATLGAKAWQNDSTELFKLQQDLRTGYSTQTVAELERQIRVVEDRMARNPVKTLIDAGLMPSIVEDVSIEDSPYTYKAQLARKVDNFTANINPTVLGVAKQVYMTRDSVVYKTLSEITQLSDFVARYTLYTHLTTRKKNPMTSEAAIQKASDSFVNYDIPMHRKLQYLDDAGLLMFMKYFVRIQRVIGALIKDNPTRVIGAVLLNQVVDLPNLVLESSVLARSWGNPLSAGAVQLPLLFDDLATVKAGVSLFK